MTDWTAVAKARALNIPDEAVKNIAPALTALEQAFNPLMAQLDSATEPAIILSEAAVLGE